MGNPASGEMPCSWLRLSLVDSHLMTSWNLPPAPLSYSKLRRPQLPTSLFIVDSSIASLRNHTSTLNSPDSGSFEIYLHFSFAGVHGVLAASMLNLKADRLSYERE